MFNIFKNTLFLLLLSNNFINLKSMENQIPIDDLLLPPTPIYASPISPESNTTTSSINDDDLDIYSNENYISSECPPTPINPPIVSKKRKAYQAYLETNNTREQKKYKVDNPQENTNHTYTNLVNKGLTTTDAISYNVDNIDTNHLSLILIDRYLSFLKETFVRTNYSEAKNLLEILFIPDFFFNHQPDFFFNEQPEKTNKEKFIFYFLDHLFRNIFDSLTINNDSKSFAIYFLILLEKLSINDFKEVCTLKKYCVTLWNVVYKFLSKRKKNKITNWVKNFEETAAASPIWYLQADIRNLFLLECEIMKKLSLLLQPEEISDYIKNKLKQNWKITDRTLPNA
ncbi:hypothetical protein GF322_05240 [Candidatus Dependentiae bacterium]|nr:hypothetical protein [Candidatus Dependentiae bacterium]